MATGPFYLREVASRVAKDGEDALAELFPSGWVLALSAADSPDAPLLVDTPTDRRTTATQKFSVATSHLEASTTVEAGPVSPWGALASSEFCMVTPVVKSERNPFVGIVCLGRALNNDIRVASTRVSKVHVFLSSVDDQWNIRDNNSRNGTLVNGLSLEPFVEHRLNPGDQVQFGDVQGLFLDAPTLVSLCRVVSLRGGRS